jgi:hypothetical protein
VKAHEGLIEAAWIPVEKRAGFAPKCLLDSPSIKDLSPSIPIGNSVISVANEDRIAGVVQEERLLGHPRFVRAPHRHVTGEGDPMVAIAEGEHIDVAKARLSTLLRRWKRRITHRFSCQESPCNERRSDAIERPGEERIVRSERLLPRVTGTRNKRRIYIDNTKLAIDVLPKNHDVVEVLDGRLEEAQLGAGGVLSGEIEKTYRDEMNFSILISFVLT